MSLFKRRPFLSCAFMALGVVGAGTTHLAAQGGGEAGSSRHIDLNVLVVDRPGTPDTSLHSSDFRVTVDGTQQTIQSALAGDTPISLAFVIDTSGSMYRQRTAISAIVTAVVQALPQGSEMAAIEFSETPHIEQPLGPVAGNRLSVLQHLDARGCTALLDAVIEGEGLLASQAHYPRRALVLIGDGGDNCSTHSIKESDRTLQQPDAPALYSFVLVPVVRNGTSPSEQGAQVMKGLVRMGGAAVFAPHKESDFTPAVAALVAAIRSQYVLTFTPAHPDHDGSRHTLDVRLQARNLLIFVLPAYFAPEN